ncbi:hypothetical protein ABIE27_001171 [Paenibacillus sp. 4624]|uniref:S-layer homology domain-containing protein n=1 Tax=Paenibacillus sp. 4624 TaxID=3156453 RepID=UPI003D25451C
MFFKRMTQKVNIFILVMSMLCLSGGVVYGQDVTSDIEGHWAQPTIDKWLSKGLIKGCSDDSFRPNNVITRGEFMALVNCQFEFNELAGVQYTDLSALVWNYSEVQKAVKEGYIKGYKLPSDEKVALEFKDSSEFSLWSKGSAGAVFSENNIGWNVDFAENNAGTAQVVTLEIENGATAPGSYYVYFTDGGAPIPKTVSITGTETATEVASKIAVAFGTSIPGWSAAADGSKVHFTSQQPGTNNEHVRLYALEASGVGAPSSTTTVAGNPATNTSQVVTLSLPGSESSDGPIGVKFMDGASEWVVHVNMMGSPETGSELADKIATAFGTTIPDWNVSASGTKVIFTAKLPAANNSKALARLSGLNTGIGMPDSKITTVGAVPMPDTAQVVTLEIENGATAPGSYYVYFTDGGAPIPETVSITGTETATEVASKIAVAFGTSIPGWSAVADGSKVHFTSQQPGTNNEHVRLYALEASGVGAPSSTTTVAGNPTTNTSQVVTLSLPGSESSDGPIGVKFMDGASEWVVHVNMMGSPETGSELADKIATAFGTTIPDWNVSASGTKVIFTAKLPAANNSKALARLSGLNTGIGMPDSKITTVGAAHPVGVPQKSYYRFNN